MLSDRLVRMIEDHADELTRALVHNLQTNPRTASYHKLPREAIHERTYNVYKNLSLWLSSKSDENIEASYTDMGKQRFTEEIPLSEVVYALILTKYHLRDYIRFAGIVDSAIELYQEQELQRLLGGFFDKAIYYTVRAYERQLVTQSAARGAKSAA
jgi:hypothetical protein